MSLSKIGLLFYRDQKLGTRLIPHTLCCIGDTKVIVSQGKVWPNARRFLEPRNRGIGLLLLGVDSTELIQGFVIAMGLETTEEELMHTVFPHPTLSEMMHESVLDAYGRVIHF